MEDVGEKALFRSESQAKVQGGHSPIRSAVRWHLISKASRFECFDRANAFAKLRVIPGKGETSERKGEVEIYSQLGSAATCEYFFSQYRKKSIEKIVQEIVKTVAQCGTFTTRQGDFYSTEN